MAKKLTKKIFFSGTAALTSGLHIGGSNLSMAIGGADAVIVRNPVNNQPYIPGSSLKGKMRSLTEKLLGAYEKGKMGAVEWVPYTGTKDGDTQMKEIRQVIVDLYGRIASGDNENIPSRIIVRDAEMHLDSVNELRDSEYTDMPFSEVKTEVVIDRVTSAAMPRQLERVPAGTKFNISIVLNVFEDDNEQKLVDYVKVGLRLVEDDFLGGKGSRGSGQVSFDWDNFRITYKDLESYEKDEAAKPYK
ncbi:MAG: type III-A CRISPR-associated RAMP protein Csm3 [Cyclonatronaceae bacterium]